MDSTASQTQDNLVLKKIAISRGYKNWELKKCGFVPAGELYEQLPSGFYEIRNNDNLGFYLHRFNITKDNILDIPMKEVEEVVTDIQCFCERRKQYEEYKLVYKRGILLYGDQGVGKTAVIQRVIDYSIREKDAIVLNLRSSDCLDYYYLFIPEVFRLIEQDRLIIVIIEDLDGMISTGFKNTLSKILNILDGIRQVNNVVYIATTNHIEKLKENISNRPSRFDRRIKVGMPGPDARRFFFEHKLTESDKKKYRISEWVEDTEGFSIAHLKELILSVCVLGYEYSDALQLMKDLKKNPTRIDNQPLGFNNRI